MTGKIADASRLARVRQVHKIFKYTEVCRLGHERSDSYFLCFTFNIQNLVHLLQRFLLCKSSD